MLEPLDRRDVPASFLWTNAYGDSDALNQDNWVRDDGEHAVPSGAATVVYFGGTMAGYTGANADSVGLSQLSGSWLMFDSTYTATVTAAGGQSLANVVMPSGNLVVSGDATIQYVMQTGGSITVAGNATVSNLGESGGEFTVAGDATITSASVNSGSVWLWEEATVGSLSVYSGTAEVDGAAAITTLAVRGGMATLSGGRVGSATVTDDPYTAGGAGVLALKAGTSFEGFTMDAGEVVQDAAADMTVTNSFTWTGGDINADGNAASLTLDGANGTIAPAEAGSLTIGDTLQLINEAYATFYEGTLAFAGGEGILVDSGSTAEIAPPANANTAVTFAPAGSTVGPQVIHLVNGGEYVVGRVNRTAIGYHTTQYPILNEGGSVQIAGAIDVTVSGAVGGSPGPSLYQLDGETRITSGSVLRVSNGMVAAGGSLVGNITSGLWPKIAGNLTNDGADVWMTGSYGGLTVEGNITWYSGTYYTRLAWDGPDSDGWAATGTFTIGSEAAVYASVDNLLQIQAGTWWAVLRAVGGFSGSAPLTQVAFSISITFDTPGEYGYLVRR